MKSRYTSRIAGALVCLALFSSLGACNSADDSSEIIVEAVASNVAVTSFELRADKDIMVGLDSVFFAIDLNQRVIYNADSLPKGTKIDKLTAKIGYGSDVSVAEVIMRDPATNKADTLNYWGNPTDSIDFTREVTLHLKARGNMGEATYRLKVNVHQMVADTLSWGDAAVCNLPSRLPSPREQRTVKFADKARCLILEADGTYTLASNADPASNAWDKTKLQFSFVPAVRSLTATSDALYILSSAGELMKSTDEGLTWTSTQQHWSSVLGAYADRLLGLTSAGGTYSFAEFPARDSFVAEQVPAGFPVSGYTPLCSMTSRWAEAPIVFTTGGVAADGSLVEATWGYDGFGWTIISEAPAPALVDASMVGYTMFRQPLAGRPDSKEYNVWLIVGGRRADGSLNETIYASLDAGIHWTIFSAANELPKAIAPTTQADMLTLPRDMEASLTDAWKTAAATRVDYTIDGYDISWICPHLYLFGGRTDTGALSNSVWKAVLQRLLFTPII